MYLSSASQDMHQQLCSGQSCTCLPTQYRSLFAVTGLKRQGICSPLVKARCCQFSLTPENFSPGVPPFAEACGAERRNDLRRHHACHQSGLEVRICLQAQQVPAAPKASEVCGTTVSWWLANALVLSMRLTSCLQQISCTQPREDLLECLIRQFLHELPDMFSFLALVGMHRLFGGTSTWRSFDIRVWHCLHYRR